MSFDLMAEGLSLFSKRWLVVEFSPCERETGGFGWYTLENFQDALKKRFRAVEPAHPYAQDSVLLVCEK
jgi:hypothetical protein